jgi:hypothetical protein
MDYQVLFNIAFTVAGVFGGYMLNSIFRAIERLDDDVRAMPHNYVSKDDYKTDLAEIKGMLARIFDKLDAKVDK